jgi:hypothetical protein
MTKKKFKIFKYLISSDSESPDLVDDVLPGLPLVPQHCRRDHAVRRSQLLLRLVERQERDRVLEEMEPARPRLVCPASLQARHDRVETD